MITAIFDLDGTLADTLQDLADACNYGLRALGCPEHTLEEYRIFVGNGVKKLCLRALPDGRKDDSDKLNGLFSEYYNAHYIDKTSIYPHMHETLKTLADNGIVLAVATNKPQEFARKIISVLLPDIEFIKVLGGCKERPTKPDTAIIREILAPLLPDDNEVYMIGDSNVDIQTAKNAGITSIGCLWGFRSRQELETAGADYIISSPSEIVNIILGENQ